MLRYFISSAMLFFSFCVYSQSDIVQGPFKINGDDTVFIQKEADINYPLALYFSDGISVKKVDSYEVDGDDPNVETVFFTKIKNVNNVIVLISWHQKHMMDNISGNSYQVYGYMYNKNSLSINQVIKDDPNLSGLDGDFSGKQLHFKYKDAMTIKEYLKVHYQ
ncbi:hypothetical protein ACSFCX_14945 [Yokenella regensburgei]|uniref:hypothetical protein n=1 Tax=Yokenella regensburgei TaxID=158877 RepID=UPI0035B0CBE0